MSKRFSNFIQLGIIGIWLVLVFLLIYRHYISGAEVSQLKSLSANNFRTSEDWFGIYFKNHKVGFIKTTSEKIGNEYRFVQFGETNLSHNDRKVNTVTKFKCLTDLEYRIKSFEFETHSGESYFKSSGRLDEDNMLLVFMESDRKKKTRAKEIHSQPYLPVTVRHLIFSQDLEKGKRFKIPVLDIFTLEIKDTIVEVLDLIPVKAGVNIHTAYMLKIGENISWISDGGKVIKEQYPAGFQYYAEAKTFAKSRDVQYLFDYLSVPYIKTDSPLLEPEEISQIRLRLSGLDTSAYPLLNGGRQTLRGNILEISREDAEELKSNTYDLPYDKNDLKTYLSPTKFVQSDHHTIIYNAKNFVDIEKNAFRLANYLTSNLYLTIQKRPSFPILKTMDIFKVKAGGSNEHTVMFTSFARASGLPTRMVGGVVYRYGYFYYHSWPEVWLGKWVPADPELSQFPADVTHIRLVEGDIDEIASIINIMKNLKIEIIDKL